MSQQRTFRMHPRLLFQTIQRQAGTLAKAITEGVMNSVEAGASRVDVTVREDHILIEDDGRGFQSLEEIENWFETFGMPHGENEGKIWANFRIGRGQLFSFGKNTWRTQRYRMVVDFRAAAKDADTLGYELQAVEEEHPGCRVRIDLYHPLLPSGVHQTETELRQLVKWIAVPVYLNDKRVSTDPAKAKWDYEDPLCYVKLRQRGGLAVYNLGVFVREYPASQFGCGGDVVSKHQLRLNQARSDVLVQDCEVWRRVRKQIDAFVGRKIRRKPSLSDVEKDFLALKMLTGELPEDAFGQLKLFTDVTGKSHSWDGLTRLQGWPCCSVGDRYNRIADQIHQQKLAFVFSRDCLDRFNVETVEELFEKVRETDPQGKAFPLPYRPLEEIARGFRHDFQLVQKEDVTPAEQIVLDLCQKADHWLLYFLQTRASVSVQARNYVVGISDAADAWTDGATFIAISRSWLRRRPCETLEQLTELATLLLHEYCHGEPDTETHTHSPEFYRQFHDASDGIGYFVQQAVRALPATVAKFKRRVTKRIVKLQDRIEVAKRLLPQIRETDWQGRELVAAKEQELRELERRTPKRKRVPKTAARS